MLKAKRWCVAIFTFHIDPRAGGLRRYVAGRSYHRFKFGARMAQIGYAHAGLFSELIDLNNLTLED